MMESMRLYPAVSIALPRITPENGTELCGKHIPQGTEVVCNTYALHHSKDVFERPDEFLPERWLITDEEKLTVMKKTWNPFSWGPRQCLGQK